MRPFVVTRDCAHPPVAAWSRITDWSRHARWVPLTTIEVVTPLPNGVGTVFNARTAVGPLGFDDPMEIVEWQPPSGDSPGRCRVEKRGTVMHGWAELAVQPTGAGSRATWTGAITPARLPAFTDPVSRLASTLLFGRLLRRLLED